MSAWTLTHSFIQTDVACNVMLHTLMAFVAHYTQLSGFSWSRVFSQVFWISSSRLNHQIGKGNFTRPIFIFISFFGVKQQMEWSSINSIWPWSDLDTLRPFSQRSRFWSSGYSVFSGRNVSSLVQETPLVFWILRTYSTSLLLVPPPSVLVPVFAVLCLCISTVAPSLSLHLWCEDHS